MRKKMLVLFLAMVIVFSMALAGCGKDDAPKGDVDTPAGTEDSTKDDTPSDDGDSEDADAPEESAELSLWTWKVAMTPGFEAAADKFEQMTGHKIVVDAFTPDDTYRQKVIASANSGDLPDLIHWWATRGVGFENVLVNMTDKVTEDYKGQFMQTAFNESIVRERDVKNWADDSQQSDVVKALEEGDCYQIPVDVGGFFTVYANNEILEEVGLDNKVPESYEEFIEFSKKVNDETDYAGFIFAGGLADVYYNWMGRAVEATFLGVEKSVGLINRTEKMSDPENIKPLKMFEELCKSGAILDGATALDIDAGDMAFAAGEAAYLLGGTFTYGQLNAMGMDVSNVSSFVVPMMENSAVSDAFGITPFTLTAMAISEESEHKDIAWDFIQYIALDPEGVTTFANGAYIIPAADLGDAMSDLTPALQDMYNSLSDEESVVTKVDNWPDSIGRKEEWNQLYDDMQKIMTGELTAEEAAANFDKNAEEEAAAGN